MSAPKRQGLIAVASLLQRPPFAQQALISFAPKISVSESSYPQNSGQNSACHILLFHLKQTIRDRSANTVLTYGDCCEPPLEFMGMWVTSVQEFRWLLWSTYLLEDTEMHLNFQTGFLLVTHLLLLLGVCKAIAVSSGCDDPSGLQQDALKLAFGISLMFFGFQVTSNCWPVFIWNMFCFALQFLGSSLTDTKSPFPIFLFRLALVGRVCQVIERGLPCKMLLSLNSFEDLETF